MVCVIYCTALIMLSCFETGGWNVDGKGPSIWDTFTHQKGKIFQDQTGDRACNSYGLWEEDLKCIKQLGLSHYRLSFSWSRLLPEGTACNINKKGRLLGLLLSYTFIEPFCWHYKITVTKSNCFIIMQILQHSKSIMLIPNL